MARTLTAKVATAVSQLSTSPIYLVSLGYTTIIRLSTLGTVNWNGQTWSNFGVEVKGIRYTRGGGQTASLKIPNHDNAYSALILGEGIRDIPVNIYSLYGDEPYDVDDAQHVFQGVIDSVPSIGDFVDMHLVSEGVQTAWTPRIALSAFLGNDLPVPGTRIRWNGDTLVLESQ
ncbi:MAG: hypothetical protein JAY88_14785 [Candidatus Thiodiazotropha lotti]|nr:hypothetical protein [Candidatus Thiodiazotropha lotti]MCW4188330.1 hypothetical protein [Candidatus Thiodiazotropha lotti]